MNKLEIYIEISQQCDEEVKYDATIRSNYIPGDTNSIFNCISDLNDKTTRVKEDVEKLNRICQNNSISGFKGGANITACRIRFTRPDGTVIEDIEVNDFEEIEFTARFLNTFNYV